MSNNSISDVMVNYPEVQVVKENDCFHDAVIVLNNNRWGAVFVVTEDLKVLGIITDGDARRILANTNESIAQLNSAPVSKFINSKPTIFKDDLNCLEALKIMNDKMFLCAPVTNSEGIFKGVVHIQHLVGHVLKSESL